MKRPIVPIISNSLTPYRLHFHRRLIREQPGIEWWSLFTHDVSNAPWAISDEQEIRPVRFGQGERSDDQSKLSRSIHEYRKGGRIIRWLQEHQASAVIMLGYNDAGRRRIISWCNRKGIPCFLFGDSNIRGDRVRGWKALIKQRILPRIIRKCTGALVCGSLGRAYFRRYGMPDDRIFYMPYEPDYAMIQNISKQDIDQHFQRLHLSRQRQYVLYCGRLTEVKRVDLLLSAFAAIADVRPDWDLLIVGDGPLKSTLQSQIPIPLVERIHWLGFLADQRTIAAIQRGSRVLVLPSDYEPWGVVINEGVAAGCAVVATDAVGAAAELVRDGINGRVVPLGNLAQLEQALLEVTQLNCVLQFQAASLDVLSQWRQSADPVSGLMQALNSAGVISINVTAVSKLAGEA